MSFVGRAGAKRREKIQDKDGQETQLKKMKSVKGPLEPRSFMDNKGSFISTTALVPFACSRRLSELPFVKALCNAANTAREGVSAPHD